VAARTTPTTDAIAWRHAQDALACDALEPWAHGTVLRTPSSPDYWDVNAVRVEAAGLSPEALEAAGDALLAGLRHRKLDIEDEQTGAAAQPYFAAKGWMAERLAMMRRERRGVTHADVVEVSLAETRALRVEWFTAHADEIPEQEAFAKLQEPIAARRGMRAFVVAGKGFAWLAAADDGAEIDSLFVTPRARGEGVGARLVETALAAGGREVAWIVADDEGRARPLYERLGFVTVWRPYNFVQRPKGG
jgi:ribosomal protein S18 acetylase RimI-like enzyme